MNFDKVLKLMRKYNNCPKCGHDKIGNGEGKILIEDEIFIRECKCGFKVIVDENDREVKSN